MTGFLASVASVEEARLVCSLGVDVIDLKDPNRGALGALEQDKVRLITALVGKTTTLSATIGDLPAYAAELESAVLGMHASGVDIVKVGVFAGSLSPFTWSALDRLTDRNIRIVLVFFAEFSPVEADFEKLKSTGVMGVMLDTCDKASGNLREKMEDGALAQFVADAKRAGLITGLAGALTGEDIPPLLRINPDYLGFRGALCRQHERTMQIDSTKVTEIRKLIPENTSISKHRDRLV